MSVSNTEKLTVVVPHDACDALILALMRQGAVALSKPLPEGDGADLPAPEIDTEGQSARLARIEEALAILNRYGRKKRRALTPTEPLDREDFLARGADRAAWSAVCEAQELVGKEAELQAAIAEERNRLDDLFPYLPLTLPMGFKGTESTALLLGSLPRKIKTERVRAALDGLGAEVFPVSADKHSTYVSLLVFRGDLEAVTEALSALGFSPAPAQSEVRTAAALYDKAEKALAEKERALAALYDRLAELARERTEVEALYDIERTDLLIAKAKAEMGATKTCVVLNGFIPRRAHAETEKILAAFPAAYEFTPCEKGEAAPRLMSDRRFTSPAKAVLGLYAYPKCGRFDPAVPLGILYALIFGFLFADIGCGLVLGVTSLLIARFSRHGAAVRHTFGLLSVASLASLLFGLLFGKIFGNTLPELLSLFGAKPDEGSTLLALDAWQQSAYRFTAPLRSPWLFGLGSLGVAAIPTLVVLILRAVALCKAGRRHEALWDTLPVLLMLGGGFTLFFFPFIGLDIVGGALVLSFVAQAMMKKGRSAKSEGGVVGLAKPLAALCDLACYGRVALLGVTASAIGLLRTLLAMPEGNALAALLMTLLAFGLAHLLNLLLDLAAAALLARRTRLALLGDCTQLCAQPHVPLALSERYTTDMPNSSAKNT